MKQYNYLGMDEAGLGPNLGPLVHAIVGLSLPSPAAIDQLWNSLNPVISAAPPASLHQLHVADSKVVYTAGGSREPLERAVAVVLRHLGYQPRTVAELLTAVCATSAPASEPWFTDIEFPLASWWSDQLTVDLAADLGQQLASNKIEVFLVAARITWTSDFNAFLESSGNKAEVTSSQAMSLLKTSWPDAEALPTLLVADKHGGRNRYDGLLSLAYPGLFVSREQETALLSRYHLGNMEARFQPRAESHFPVALASMICKTLRELLMDGWNSWWGSRIPGIKPTKGYPVDAKRFAADSANFRAANHIADRHFWRAK